MCCHLLFWTTPGGKEPQARGQRGLELHVEIDPFKAGMAFLVHWGSPTRFAASPDAEVEAAWSRKGRTFDSYGWQEVGVRLHIVQCELWVSYSSSLNSKACLC